MILYAHFIGLQVVVWETLFPAKAILDPESPIVNSAVDDVFFQAASDKRGSGMWAWIIDRVKPVRKVINANPFSVNVEALGVAHRNFCCPANDLKF